MGISETLFSAWEGVGAGKRVIERYSSSSSSSKVRYIVKISSLKKVHDDISSTLSHLMAH